MSAAANRPRRVAVLGGGISGLASAWHLAAEGHRVTLLESTDELGGLAGSFDYQGAGIERFYHCLLPTDSALLALLREVGLESRVVWRPVGMGFMVAKRVYPMNTAVDLLRFSPLPWIDRLRMGLMALQVRRHGAPIELDGVTVRDWLVARGGERLYERLWRPLLEAKLGDSAGRIPALWLASRIAREKSSQKEVKGFVPGGYREIVRAIAGALEARGVAIRMRARVESVAADDDGADVVADGAGERFDAVVSTLPYSSFRGAARGAVREALGSLDLDYQGVINAIFLTRRPLSRYYWMPIVESGAVCQGVIEMSNLVPPERGRDYYINYFVNYTHRGGALYAKSDGELLDLYAEDLRRLFPHAADGVVDRALFRTPYVEPIWPLKYASVRPRPCVVPRRVYMACTAQVYPQINAWNSCCETAEETARAFRGDHVHSAEPAAAGRA